jgi:hypothetical protein
MSLITTPEDLKPYLPVPYNNRLNSLPDFTLAEEKYLLPILGQALYNETLQPNPSGDMTTLIGKCRAVIAPFGYVDHIDFLQVQLSDNGLVALEPEQHRKAYKWENNAVKDTLTNLGFSRQESLIQYLTTNKNTYPLWSNSPYNNSDFAFIRNGEELSTAITIYQPHRSFMTLKPLFAEIGELTIKSALSDQYYEDLSERLLAGTDEILPEEKPVLRLIRMAAARLVMIKAAGVMNVRYSAGAGFTIADTVKDSPNEGRKNADQEQLYDFKKELQLSANALLDKATSILDTGASATAFPLYYSSDKYINPHVSGMKLRSDRNGMFTL